MKCYEKCIPEKCNNGTMPLLSYYIICKCYDCIHAVSVPIIKAIAENLMFCI